MINLDVDKEGGTVLQRVRSAIDSVPTTTSKRKSKFVVNEFSSMFASLLQVTRPRYIAFKPIYLLTWKWKLLDLCLLHFTH